MSSTTPNTTTTTQTPANIAEPVPQDEDTSAEMKIINDEYKLWKKNAPFLYDLVMTHALEWPSLTVQWLPDKISVPTKDYTVQRLLTGTHTFDGEQNYLCVAEVRLPKSEDRSSENRTDATTSPTAATAPTSRADRTDTGGYGVVSGKIEIVQQIVHKGEVNRARYMPQNPNIIATKSNSTDVYIFDKSKHPSRPAKSAPFAPDLCLTGHKAEGYGLSWSPLQKGYLLSGSDDALICLWDIQNTNAKDTKVEPLSTFMGHKAVVEDVAFHPFNSNIFGSVSDDQTLMIWDHRTNGKPISTAHGHSAEVNSLSFNLHNEHLLATGSSDTTCGLWDMRCLSKKLHSFESHQSPVFTVAWAPFSEYILASGSTDRRVILWDVLKIGEEQDGEDAEDGPPELLLIHAGHTDKIADLSWNANEPWTMASVADDAMLQIWRPSEAVYSDDTNEDDEDDENDDDVILGSGLTKEDLE